MWCNLFFWKQARTFANSFSNKISLRSIGELDKIPEGEVLTRNYFPSPVPPCTELVALFFRNQFPHGSLFMIIDNKLGDLKNCEHHLLSEPFNLRLLFFFWKKGMAVLSVVYLA